MHPAQHKQNVALSDDMVFVPDAAGALVRILLWVNMT